MKTRGYSSRGLHRLTQNSRGSQLLELALVTPLLLVFVVGIIDFSGAFNLKQRLSNAAREGARLASSESPLDLTAGGTPPSITAVKSVVSNYLTNAGITQCSLATSPSASGMIWTYSSSSTGCGSFALIIDRSYTGTKNGGTTIVSSHVTINYPYTWTFNRVIGLLVRGSNPTMPSTISSDAILQNQ